MNNLRERYTLRRLGIVAAIAVSTVLIGNVGSYGADKKFTIGFVSPGADSPFWIDTAKGAAAAGDSLADVEVVVGTATQSGDPSTWVPVVQNMFTRGVDAIVVPGVAQLVPALQRFKSANIPIIFYSNGIPGSDLPVSTVNTDSEKGGELAGKYIKQQLGGKGTLAIIRYPKGAYPLIDKRVTGVLNELEGTAIEISYLDVGCDSPAPAIAAAQNLLTRMPNISGFFGQCGAPVLGAQQAAKQANIDPAKILMVGYDGTTAEIQAIIDGSQDATVAQYPVKMGELAVQTAHDVLMGQSVPAEIDPGTLLITKENAAEELNHTR